MLTKSGECLRESVRWLVPDGPLSIKEVQYGHALLAAEFRNVLDYWKGVQLAFEDVPRG